MANGKLSADTNKVGFTGFTQNSTKIRLPLMPITKVPNLYNPLISNHKPKSIRKHAIFPKLPEISHQGNESYFPIRQLIDNHVNPVWALKYTELKIYF